MKKKLLNIFAASLGFLQVMAVMGQCPTITCPGNITVTSDPGSCSAVVSYVPPVGTDPCSVTTQTFNYTGSIDTWIVPTGVTSVTIEAKGAQGGYNTSSSIPSGLGADMKGDFAVTPGSTLKILVGQQPTANSGNGGGGGTFVTDVSNSPLIVAGGGGGSASTTDSPDKNGQVATTAGTGAAGGGAGGTAGNGGSIGASGFQSGAGGGLLTNGNDGWTSGTGGSAFVNGGAGGPTNAPANGGFGGGGSGSSYVVGGGGGGYSGGGSGGNSSAGVGGGGGSFNAGTSQLNTGGINSGNGLVAITYISSATTITTTMTAGLASGSAFPSGVTTVTYMVDNGIGGTSSCSFSVTVTDNQAPVPDVASLPAVTGECSAAVSAPTATDNCAGAVTATTTDPLSYSAQGSYIVNWTYDDGNGNTSTQTQSVTIADITTPVADAASLMDITGICSATVSAVPTATDNCAGAVTATTTDPMSYTATGSYVIHWTYDDGNGNTSVQTQNVIISGVDTAVSITGGTLTAGAGGATYSWLDCGSSTIIGGATSQSYTVTSNGSYALVIMQSGCTDTSACYSFMSTGIAGNNETLINIYPNPTHGMVMVDLGSITEGTIQVSDMLGRIIVSKKIQDHTASVDLSSFDNGIFSISVETSSSRKVSRLIKN